MADFYTRNSRTSAPRKDVTLQVPTAYTVKTFGQETVVADFSAMSPEMLETILMEGALRMLNDGAGGKDKTDTERAAGMRKRLDSWKAGAFRIAERGDALTTLMREAFQAELSAKVGGQLSGKAFTDAQAQLAKKAGHKVEAGKVIPLDMVILGAAMSSTGKGADHESTIAKRDEITARLEDAARAISAERASAIASVDLSGIDF